MARSFVTRTLRNGQKDDGSFDRAFWKAQGDEAIFAAAWEMVTEVAALKGQADADEPGLQRSAVRVERKRR